jgi:hypothetical protein
MILIDSNVLLDISSNDPIWFDWSAASIAELASEYALCINPIIYAEASVKFNSPADFDRAFAAQDFIRKIYHIRRLFSLARRMLHIDVAAEVGSRRFRIFSSALMPWFRAIAYLRVTHAGYVDIFPRYN